MSDGVLLAAPLPGHEGVGYLSVVYLSALPTAAVVVIVRNLKDKDLS